MIRGYHLMTAEHAMSSIMLRRLKVARFSDVNDPFELFGLNCFGPNGPERRRALGEFKQSQNNTTGLLCFSAKWKSPVLWSHYADGHKGICLGFDLNEADVRQVTYNAEKLNLNADQDPLKLPKEVRERLFITKFEHWRYEEELRIFVPLSETTREGALHFYPFGDDLRLKDVILGHLCPASRLKPIRDLVRAMKLDAKVSKARLGFKYFEVKEDGRYPPE
jgi:hypothetical protein